MRIYLCEIGQFSAEMLTRMQKTLPERRRALVERCTSPLQKAARTVGFYLVFHAALAERPLPFTDWEIAAGGKPRLAASPLHFSLSHTDALVAVALSATHPVGVDVEKIRPHGARFAQKYFSEKEQKRVAAAEDPVRELTALWTAKEARAKQSGTGLCAEIAGIGTEDTATAFLQVADLRYALSVAPAAEISPVFVSAKELLSLPVFSEEK